MQESAELDQVAITGQQRFDLGIQAAVAILGLAVLAVLVWALPRGFDIRDEGFYTLNYRFPVEYEINVSTVHLLVTRLLGLTNASVLAYRAVGLAAVGLGGLVFSLSLSAWLRTTLVTAEHSWVARPVLVVGVVLLGALLAFSAFPRSISYNTLTTFLLLVSAGAVLTALRRGPDTAAVPLLTVGFTLGLALFIKFSSAVLLLAAAVAVLGWCWRRAGWLVLIKTSSLIGLGFGLGLGLYFCIVQPPVQWWHNFTQEMAVLQSQGGYGLLDLLPRYLANASKILLFLAFPMGPVLVLLAGLAWWWPRRRMPQGWHSLVVGVLLGGGAVFLLVQALHRRWYSNAISNHFETLPLLLALLLLVVVVVCTEMIDNRSFQQPAVRAPAAQVVPVGLWLLALPLLAAVGTINDLRLNLLIDMGPWFGLLLVLLALPRPARLPRWVPAVLLLLPTGFVAEQTVWGILWTPLNLSATMAAQTAPLHIAGGGGTIQIDPPTRAFVNRLEELLAAGGFRVGDPLLAFYDMPGLVYLSGGISPGTAWFFQKRDQRNCHALTMTRQPLHKAYILLNQPIGPELKQCLHEQGLLFPENYRLVGTALSSYITEHRQVQVYAPLPAR